MRTNSVHLSYESADKVRRLHNLKVFDHGTELFTTCRGKIGG